MNNRFHNMLGLARRAGRLSSGHDAAVDSIRKGQACICFVTEDGSERLKREMKRTVERYDNKIPYVELKCTQYDIREATGLRSAVITVNDAGFASRLQEFLSEEDTI